MENYMQILKLSFGQILAILNLGFLIWIAKIPMQIQGDFNSEFFTGLFIPFALISFTFWFEYYKSGISLFLLLISVMLSSTSCSFDSDARHPTTKNSLYAIKSSIALYRSRNNKLPLPTMSGSTNASEDGGKTLEAILSNLNGFGDGQEYIGGAIPGELISDAQGNNFVCLVLNDSSFYADQSTFENCINNAKLDLPRGIGGGYVYHLKSGKIRLDFQVFGPDLRERKQHNIGALFQDWKEWLSQHEDLKDDYPVRW